MSSTAQSQTITKKVHRARAASLMSDRHRSDILAAVLQIAGQIAGILDLEPLLDQIAQQTKALLGYRDVALLLVEGDMLAYRACAGEQTLLPSLVNHLMQSGIDLSIDDLMKNSPHSWIGE